MPKAQSSDLSVVILAAGKGTRMKSDIPKALHPVCGKPMLWHLLNRAKELKAKRVITVAGFKSSLVRANAGSDSQVIDQKIQAGSGHALMQAARALSGVSGPVMVLYCDTPLLSIQTLKRLVDHQRTEATLCSLLSVKLEDPSGYGRIKRSELNHHVEKIVEHLDATHIERAIKEINVGAYVFEARALFEALKEVKKNPVKNEYYLTDVVEILAKRGIVEAIVTEDKDEVHGINTQADLSKACAIMQKRILSDLSARGVLVRDPGMTTVAAGVEIGSGTVIEPYTMIEEDCRIGRGCHIGPFARLRGQSVVGNNCIIGNFVEIVRSEIGDQTQIKHLSYLGDTKTLKGVNIGAGTITANFDGKKKHKTLIKSGAQIGSGTILIAPVQVGQKAKTGAGAVVTRNRHIKDKSIVVGIPAKPLT